MFEGEAATAPVAFLRVSDAAKIFTPDSWLAPLRGIGDCNRAGHCRVGSICDARHETITLPRHRKDISMTVRPLVEQSAKDPNVLHDGGVGDVLALPDAGN